MPRLVFQKGSQIQENKKNYPRNGVIVSADPAFKGQRQRWLVKFDGEDEPVSRSSQQLRHRKNIHASVSDDKSTSSSEDLGFFWSSQDDPDSLIEEMERASNTLQESNASDEEEEEEVDPDSILVDDVVENDDGENPFVPNSTDIEKEEIHKRKWIKYIEDKKKMIDEGYVISILPSRQTKLKVGDQVKWVSYLYYFFCNNVLLLFTNFSL